MIDETNLKIGEMRERIEQANTRRYAFYTMLHTTDRILWRLEEMNRDGEKTLTAGERAEIGRKFSELPSRVLEVFQDSDQVQTVLDSIFEMQERLFRWRDPEWDHNDDDLERLAG